jgi:hypothetical protein
LFSSNFLERRHILILTSDRLTIAEEPEPAEEPDMLDIGDGYRFYNGELMNERSYEPWRVARVELLRTLASQGIGVSVQDEQGKPKKVFRAQEVGLSNAMIKVADACLQQGIVSPKHRLNPGKEAFVLRHQLMYREIERQFRRVAPQAEFVLKGDHLPAEVFQRVVR